MEPEHILKYYRETTEVAAISNLLRSEAKQKIQLKGLVGSMDACLSIAVADSVKQTHLFVLSEKEEAA
ncbi:MAG: hypothetical protein JKY33_09300, partial [Bacteroidia bacterium]|nr:hypothetical protein [Bacteroidia bacterium]